MKLSLVLLFAASCAVPTGIDAVDMTMVDAMPGSGAPPVVDAARPADAATGPTKTTTDNVAGKTDIFSIFNTPPTKPAQIKSVGALTATQVDPFPLPPNGSSNTIGGTCMTVSNVPSGYLVGSGGAEGCIIAIIVRGDGTVVACHFTATDDPAATLAKLAPFPAGAHAALAGGTNESVSNSTLASAIAGLSNNKVKVDGMLDRTGLYWDAANGRWVHGKNDTASNNVK